MGLITLTTDFGSSDWFVGAMKGVMVNVSGRNRIVDITHDIPPGDIMAGAFALASSYNYFPPGAIHVAVVDPGVGSSRPAIAVQTKSFVFVGPDNGVLSLALANEEVQGIHRIENEALFCHPVSRTFHGRDIFAPVAAHLGREAAIQDLGPATKKHVRLPWPNVQQQGDLAIGQVIYIDRFGNCVTNIPADSLADADKSRQAILYNGKLCPVKNYYGEVADHEPLALIGSSNYLEIAINGGNASKALPLKVGDAVSLKAE